MWKNHLICGALAVAFLVAPQLARADEATIAVATNFLEPAKQIVAKFEDETDHTIILSAGSTGQLFANVANGAPFDAFLSADKSRPGQLAALGLADGKSQFTYAIGILTLYSPDPDRIIGPVVLAQPIQALSIANPRTAPYGRAAEQVLRRLGSREILKTRTAEAQNVSGAFAAVKSGAADLGFVALSSVLSKQNEQPGSRWDPPQDLYDPLYQDAVLLTRGRDNDAAIAFLAYLKSEKIRELITSFGYRQVDP